MKVLALTVLFVGVTIISYNYKETPTKQDKNKTLKSLELLKKADRNVMVASYKYTLRFKGCKAHE